MSVSFQPVVPEPIPEVSMEPIAKVLPVEELPSAPAPAQTLPVSLPAGNPPMDAQAPPYDEEAFFTTTAAFEAPRQRSRAFQEIVSSVQGNFNFIQDSELDMECKFILYFQVCI